MSSKKFGTPAFITPSIHRLGKNTFRSKVGTHKFSDALYDAGFNAMAKQGSKATHKLADAALGKLRNMTKDMDMGSGYKIGVAHNSNNSLVNAQFGELTYKHTSSSSQQSSTALSRIYRSNFTIGTPTPKTLYEYAKNRTTDTKVLVDTDRDYLNTDYRQSLTSTFGFNQRSYDFLLGDTIMTSGDIAFLFSRYKTRSINRLANKNYYACLFFEHLHLNIKSETEYYSIRLKLHVVKILNTQFDIQDLIDGTFSYDLNHTSPGKVPIDRQYSCPVTHKKHMTTVLTDSKCSLQSSDHFKLNAKVVKTFHKVLGPSDIWDFDYYLHYGSGVLLNGIFEDDVTNGHPLGYCFIVESEGDPRASITRSSDGQNFNGTSPGRFNYSFKKTLKFIKENPSGIEKFSVREFIKNDDDFQDSAISEYFSPNRASKINVDFSTLNTNRIENSNLPYQLRFGEGRLTVYMDPALRSWIAKVEAEAENKSDDSTSNNPINVDKEPVLDPDDDNDMPGSGKTIGLRGTKMSDIIDLDLTDFDPPEHE